MPAHSFQAPTLIGCQIFKERVFGLSSCVLPANCCSYFAELLRILTLTLTSTFHYVFCTAFNTITSFSVICLHPHTYLILRSCFVQMLLNPYLIRYFSLSRLVSGAEQKIMTDLFVYVKSFWGKYPLNTIFFLKT